jgi:trehalose-6-phosphate synthase
MDYSKGLPQRFEAYASLLEKHPEHRRKVHFLQICPRSREEVDEYRRLRAELDRLTGRINGRFSEFDWTPLRYSTRAAPRTTLAGLYRIGRIGVVTPLRDGMNLVAKEYIAAQPPDDPGVLILSQFAGAAQELTEALVVNPFDPDAIADAMHVGLTMPGGRKRAPYGLGRSLPPRRSSLPALHRGAHPGAPWLARRREQRRRVDDALHILTAEALAVVVSAHTSADCQPSTSSSATL